MSGLKTQPTIAPTRKMTAVAAGGTTGGAMALILTELLTKFMGESYSAGFIEAIVVVVITLGGAFAGGYFTRSDKNTN